MESIYEWCLLCELRLQGLSTQTQRVVRIQYKEFEREDPLRFDMLVEKRILVEVKSIDGHMNPYDLLAHSDRQSQGPLTREI